MKWRAAALVLFSCVLTACGGGGGSNDAKPQSTQVEQQAVVRGLVRDEAGQPVQGVTVTSVGVQASTDAKGNYQLSVPLSGNRTVVQFERDGYAVQTGVSDFPAGGNGVRVNATLQKLGMKVDIANLASAQAFSLPTSVKPIVEFGGDALVRADGAAPKGTVTARLTVINPKADLGLMPGNYLAKTASGTQPIESYGAIQFTLRDADGSLVNLKSGQTAVIRIPAVKASAAAALPSSVPLYHFNEQTGYWQDEGVATLMPDGSGAPAYYEATVSHFSTWNADKPYDTVTLTGCVQDLSGTSVGAGLTVVSAGGDYLGSSTAMTNAAGQFSIQVKRNALSQLLAVSYAPAAVSNAVLAQATSLDGPVPSCLRIDLQAAALASYQGTYVGTYTGLDKGNFTVAIGSNGMIAGSGVSTQGNGSFGVSGQVSAAGAVSLNAAQGQAGIATFSGTVNGETGALTGTWTYLPQTGLTGGGTYQGQRQ
ncbi:MAG: carboxypeptidase regulatory-like domain-containing protein [Aquabacterium sp.]|uniref:carboxypeptidase-like regulatory domain-containing protein n=1 Tax=Aquabacterium sp. TaxID=1872578 RepID=UPI0025BC2695|nr:carboxypeptidase-like regulatory domain-containing protein [Aquabacterium sp.]MBI3384459.1 carboxypeptidase regulatory-like domain-containing protein [Aquabacterium sp.]